MNTRELNFAYKVRHALNESADKLPASTAEKLASARKIALSRQKKESGLRVLVTRPVFAGDAGRLFNAPLAWLGRMGTMVPVVALFALLASIYQVEQRHISDTAEMDVAVLADELPLSAYLDNGFNAFLADRDK
ncbi:DUF3619 family protein [Noviherbaspirillum denitrificans]|uniref:DUF3619 domain-containing protein n=1 Tax=Noviherbaspirillum denitrificans TaxID=1968433 RepID=A0A254T7H4_9BURK|nr:DUF3619 family protein [Noviherbaspirillum denitrificans]OWW18525.1 hypothetical protein AYR66_00255 [Noviherbaspirillum denitrificans]